MLKYNSSLFPTILTEDLRSGFKAKRKEKRAIIHSHIAVGNIIYIERMVSNFMKIRQELFTPWTLSLITLSIKVNKVPLPCSGI